MKILFFSDAHGNQYTVKRLFSQINVEKPDTIIFGGDIFGYYYGQIEILSMLNALECICLLGNHDRYFLDLVEGKTDEDYLVGRYGLTYNHVVERISDQSKEFLYSLKSRYDLVIDGLRLVYVHGSLDNPLNGRIYPDAKIDNLDLYDGIDYVFMGHTHHKLVLELDNGTVLLNPGSIGQQRDGKGCTYGVFDTKNREWKIQEITFDKDRLVAEVLEHKENAQMRNKLIEVLYRTKRD